jgi:hypothetical protein
LSSRHTAQEYLDQAAHNAGLAAYLRTNKTDYLDWAATCLFYSAVHYVNAFLAYSGKSIPRRHTSSDPANPGRTNIVQQDSVLRSVYHDYRHLDDESRDARYELRKPKKADYDERLVRCHNRIRQFVTTRLAS